jgi:AcrR family transcriptional regulator
MAKKTNIEADASTEEKIKQAARKVFTQKGFAATRTRDIAEEAGINLALLNYYFRSKEKLFEIVMLEKVQKLLGVMFPVLNDTTTSLATKIDQIVNNYIDMLTQNQDLPIFVLSEIRNNPDRFAMITQAKTVILESYFIKQLQEARPDIHPMHLLMNLLGMTLFPFIGKPVLQRIGSLDEQQFLQFMEQRRTLIPASMKATLNIS